MTFEQTFRQNENIDARGSSFVIGREIYHITVRPRQALPSENDLDIELDRRPPANLGFIIHPEDLASGGELSNLESPLGEVTAGASRAYPVADIPSDVDDWSDGTSTPVNIVPDDVHLALHTPAICPPVNNTHPLRHDVVLDIQPSETAGTTDLHPTSTARNDLHEVGIGQNADDHPIIFSRIFPHAFPYFFLPTRYSSKARPVLKNVNASGSALQDLDKSWEDFLKFLSEDWKSLGALSLVLITLSLSAGAASKNLVTITCVILAVMCAFACLFSAKILVDHFDARALRNIDQASHWVEEVQESPAAVWNAWNVLAMPLIWLAWGFILLCVSAISIIFTVDAIVGSNPKAHYLLSFFEVFSIPIALVVAFFGLIIVHFVMILRTLRKSAWDFGAG